LEPDVHICMPELPCVVYSFGIANNWLFDDLMLDHGCSVWSFDPSMTVGTHKRRPTHLFEPIGIGASTGVHRGESTLYGGKTDYNMMTLQDLMARYGHTHVDIVRMDVESAEWGVLDQWNRDKMWPRIGQLLLEIHLFKPASSSYQAKPLSASEASTYANTLTSIPMTLFHVAQNKDQSAMVRLHGDMTRVYEIGMIVATTSKTFDAIYASNKWSSSESRSGEGSEMAVTRSVRKCLGEWLVKYDVATFGDACGDANWQSQIQGFRAVRYTGYDVSPNAIRRAKAKNERESNAAFRVMDLSTTVPPKHDLFMVRDVVQHLPWDMGVQLLRNVRRSGAKYLAVSSFPGQSGHDIGVGDFYHNDVYAKPFDVLRLPPAIETCENYDGVHRSMGSKLLLIPLSDGSIFE